MAVRGPADTPISGADLTDHFRAFGNVRKVADLAEDFLNVDAMNASDKVARCRVGDAPPGYPMADRSCRQFDSAREFGLSSVAPIHLLLHPSTESTRSHFAVNGS